MQVREQWLAEEIVVGRGLFLGWGSAEDVGDAEGDGVGVEAKAAAVVAGESDMAVDGDVERVGEAVVFGDVVADDDGAVGGRRRISSGRRWGAARRRRSRRWLQEEIDGEADLEVGERAERGVVLVDVAVDESGDRRSRVRDWG